MIISPAHHTKRFEVICNLLSAICNVAVFFHLATQSFAAYSSVWYAFPYTVTIASSTPMTSPKTINPSQLFNMPTQAQDTQSFDPSSIEADFDMENFDFTTTLPMDFEGGSGYDDSSIQEPVSTFNFGAANTFQPFSQAPQQTFPMQINPSPVTLTPTQVLPTVPPGLAYHPQVGWYYPAVAPTAGPSTGSVAPQVAPPPMMAPFAVPQIPTHAQTPAAPVPLFNEPSAVQVKPDDKKRGSRGTKRKYGPSAYLDEQAKRRAAGDDSGPRPVSRDSIDFGYDSRPKSSRTSPRTAAKGISAAPTVEFLEQTGERMKELKTATMQKCSCPTATAVEANHIPRPRNAFMIFRNDFAARWRTSHGEKRGLQNPDISREAGRAWHALKTSDKASWNRYKQRADAEKKQHKRNYPEYKYMPLKKIQASFGQPGCSCGAYKLNLAELQRLRDGAPTPENRFTGAIGGSDAEDGEYNAPRTRSRSRANIHKSPTSQISPFTFGQDMPDFGFGLESQNAAAVEEWAALQAFNAASAEEPEEPPAKRRSARTASKAVHYAEVEEDSGEEDVEMAFTTPRKHRPAPISTSRKPSSQLSEINSADFRAFINDSEDEGPAARTRSKSIGETAMAEPKTANSNSSSMRSLFEGDDESEAIVVATPTPKTKLTLPNGGKRQIRSQSRGRKRQRS